MSEQKKQNINLALVGYANVGKSVIFNYFTGLHQHIGNWPGKTIERAEGTLYYNGCTIDVIDLPGICSLSTYSLEELVTREYIVSAKPDFVANVVDATNLERNLILTLQFLELEKPTILLLNMVNLLKSRGIAIDFAKLEMALGIPVVPVIATQGKGLTDVLDRGIDLVDQEVTHGILKYGLEVEARIEQLSQMVQNVEFPYPKRFVAIKLLEKDEEIWQLFDNEEHQEILEKTKQLNSELEAIHGHSSAVVIADERCHLATQIAKQVMIVAKPQKIRFSERIENLTGHRIWGYPVMIFVLGLVFFAIFKGGGSVEDILINLTSNFKTNFQGIFGSSLLASLLWGGVESFIALVQIALSFILPFYFCLFMLEDFGYLARVAYLMDNLMHKLGIHGKACIPLMLGFGCNVPACLACRIMETKRERFITGLLAVFIPCSAVTVIIAGLVGKFVGIGWAFGLYLFVFALIFIIGKVAAIVTPGEPTELIMEMPSYKFPNIRTVALQIWFRLREFIYVASPIVIISGMMIRGADEAQLLAPVNDFLSPVTSIWLGLPAVTGILLILGVIRKELILIMLASVFGTENFAQVLTQAQILVLALVSMLYIPCAATIAALYKEFGWEKAVAITVFKIALAIVVGGLVLRLLSLINL